jgi:hypothetical protein
MAISTTIGAGYRNASVMTHRTMTALIDTLAGGAQARVRTDACLRNREPE